MKKITIMIMLVVLLSAIPLLASPNEAGAQDGNSKAGATNATMWALIVAGAAIVLAAVVGAIAQSKAVVAVAEGISRNPATSGDLRTVLILGLAFIESLVIYVLLIDFFIFFVKWSDIIAK